MMKTVTQNILTALFFTAVFLTQSSCRDSYKVRVSGPITLAGEWVEFHPKSPLKAENTFQWVLLDLESPFQADLYKKGNGPNKGKGILMPEGDVINPEIEVINQYGNAFSLVFGGGEGLAPMYAVPYPNELPRDREYKTIRIRSPRLIKCNAIYWYCESSKDWK